MPDNLPPQRRFNLLFLSTPVGAIGSGLGGGVELSIHNTAKAMIHRGHSVEIVAPSGSHLDGFSITQISGNLQIIAQSQERSTPINLPVNSVLANMWEYARQVENKFDLIVNFAYDWLPFYLTPFFSIPIAHIVSMGSLSDALDQTIAQISHKFPHTIGFCTASQAATFPNLNSPLYYLSNGIDLSLYKFCSQPRQQLAWLGRISPEKALEDAVQVAIQTDMQLKIMGKIQDESYWQQICHKYPHAPIEYLGFLSTEKMQEIVRQCGALIMTPRWVEAFGNVAIEALACGVPVISYRRGGPSEIIKDGETGFLVEPDNVYQLVNAVSKLDTINRLNCRQQAEQEFSLDALGKRFESWFQAIFQYSGLL